MFSRFTALILIVLLVASVCPQADAFTAGAGNIGVGKRQKKRTDGVESVQVGKLHLALQRLNFKNNTYKTHETSMAN